MRGVWLISMSTPSSKFIYMWYENYIALKGVFNLFDNSTCFKALSTSWMVGKRASLAGFLYGLICKIVLSFVQSFKYNQVGITNLWDPGTPMVKQGGGGQWPNGEPCLP